MIIFVFERNFSTISQMNAFIFYKHSVMCALMSIRNIFNNKNNDSKKNISIFWMQYLMQFSCSLNSYTLCLGVRYTDHLNFHRKINTMFGSSNSHTFAITLIMKLNETFLDVQSVGFSMYNKLRHPFQDYLMNLSTGS